jgi:hypothetical protein
MKDKIFILAMLVLLSGCASARPEGEAYSGFSCRDSLIHFYSKCSDKNFTKEEFEGEVISCEKELETKICDREKADLLWCMGRVEPGTSIKFKGRKGRVVDGCDCSTFTGDLKKCRMQKGVFE